jgi:hypothetical protein
VAVADSIAQSGSFQSLPFLKVKTLADMLGKVINQVHCEYLIDETLDAAEVTN